MHLPGSDNSNSSSSSNNTGKRTLYILIGIIMFCIVIHMLFSALTVKGLADAQNKDDTEKCINYNYTSTVLGVFTFLMSVTLLYQVSKPQLCFLKEPTYNGFEIDYPSTVNSSSHPHSHPHPVDYGSILDRSLQGTPKSSRLNFRQDDN